MDLRNNSREEGVVRGTTFIIIIIIIIIIIRGNKLYRSESAQAVSTCPGEGRLEAR
jgi:hypothetical protein